MRPFNNRTSVLRRRKSELERINARLEKGTKHADRLQEIKKTLEERINNNSPCRNTIRKKG